MKTESTFGTGLKAARELAGLSLREVEEATGISNAYLSQLESNKIRRPSVFFLAKLARIYAIPLEHIISTLPEMKSLPGYIEAKPVMWKWLPPPSNDEEQLEMAEYLKLIRARNRRAISKDTNRAGGTPSYEGPRLKSK